MRTMEEYARMPAEERLLRLERAPDELAAAIRGQSDPALSRRPDRANWSAKEVVCHFRDAEELFLDRFRLILTTDHPYLPDATPDRSAEEKRYLNPDVKAALDEVSWRR